MKRHEYEQKKDQEKKDYEIHDIVIDHTDRLCRFVYELMKDLIDKHSNGNIIVIENK